MKQGISTIISFDYICNKNRKKSLNDYNLNIDYIK